MRFGSFKLFLGAMLTMVLTAGPAGARGPEPALWQIKNGESTVYLFGSIHVLPRDWEWRTKPIDTAIKSANTFVFEAALTPQSLGSMKVFIRENGTLPRGKHLSRMLSPQGLEDFKALLAMTPIDRDSINVMRPWLALMMLADTRVQAGQSRVSFVEGVDFTLMQHAEEAKRPVRYLESAQTQLALLAAATPDNDIKGFEANLHQMLKSENVLGPLISNWTMGNQAAIAKIANEEMTNNPEEKRLVFDRRNLNWIPQIEKMMTEKQTFFVTVGAGHLAGPGSVLELLCKRGWKVQRIKTGTTNPPPACPAGTLVQAKTPSKATEIALRP